MNLTARHARRRGQWITNQCWCAVHKGGKSPKGYGHAVGEDAVALWRWVAPGHMIETGPWFGEDGQITDATISRSEGYPMRNERFRLTRRIRHLRAESRREHRLAKQAAANPKFPAKEYIVALAGWHAAGAIVTPDGPIYHARIVSD